MIEIKAGNEGKLRGLHQFIHEKPWNRAVRFYNGKAQQSHINTRTTQGHAVQYQLSSLPFYLIEQVHRLMHLT